MSPRLAAPWIPAALLAPLALLFGACGADAWSAETRNVFRAGANPAAPLEPSSRSGTQLRAVEAPEAARVPRGAPGDPQPHARAQEPAHPDPEAIAFPGTGGPGGNFDWCIAPGQAVILDTTSALITGGPHCTPTATVPVIGGVLDLRNLFVGQGAILKVQGPNPLLVLATGTVRIEGTIEISGSPSMGVATLNTTNIPEPGAPGQAGGGAGGTGSPLTTASDPKGGDGFGAFGAPGRGGIGGESGWSNLSLTNIDGRRGAGGGGGVLGPNQPQAFGPVAIYGDWDQTFLGLDAEPGFDNQDPDANGALSGAPGPFGGAPGSSPFSDADPGNDFFGLALDKTSGRIVVGELDQPWAGAGGGAGGDASFVGLGGTWPKIPFNPTGDEKGAGGAGGGGQLHVMALGDIVFGPSGLIRCRGGSGGGGENTLFLNRVGGASGGGSGGHVILETAGRIDLSLVLGPSSTPGQLAGGIVATGGQGGAGKSDQGGAQVGSSGKIETPPNLDACPPTSLGTSYPTSGLNACRLHVDGAGGDGGPGLIQLHTLNGLGPQDPSILLPPGLKLQDVCKPQPFGSNRRLQLLPSFLPGTGNAEAPRGRQGQAAESKRGRTRPPSTRDRP